MIKRRISYRPLAATLALGALGLALTACGNNTSLSVTNGGLSGTTWCSTQEHARLAVDRFGSVEVKEGKDICVLFADEADIYVMKIIWWNVNEAVHVEEWGVAGPISETQLLFAETQHDEAPDFPGIIGEGELTLVSDTEMTIMQLGHLINGDAARFTTTLEKVDRLPEIPVAVTYPKS
jgi:hypothetical protein